MFIYKLSPTRAIACNGNYNNELFTGSSLNRRKKRLFKCKACLPEWERTQPTKKLTVLNKKLYECTYSALFTFPSYSEKTAGEDSKKDNSNESNFSVLWNGDIIERKNRKAGIQNSCLLPDALPGETRRSGPRKLSTRSKYKIRDKIESLYNASGGRRFTFLTLTFINKVEDKTAQKVLNKFLTVARQNFGKFIYIWVAERQENGNIHFHFVTDKFFKIAKFNALWVQQQYNAGIQHSDYTQEQINQHVKAGTVQKILNPVHVKSIQSVTGLSIYLTMYVTKNTGSFNCSVWHCSRTISKLFTAVLTDKNTFDTARQPELNFSVNIKTGEIYEAKTFTSDNAIIVQIFNKKYFGKKLSELNLLNKWLLEYIKKPHFKDGEIITPEKYFEKRPVVNCLDYHSDWVQKNRAKFVINRFDGLPEISTGCKMYKIEN